MSTPLSQLFHLYSRFGFGISYPEAKQLGQKNINEAINSLIVKSTAGTYLTDIKKETLPLRKEALENGMTGKAYQKMVSETLRELNINWLNKLMETENVLLEKQTLFWHNHFACRVRQPYLMQELNNIHRRFAFSNFRELLVEVCKSPAMLLYLNNQQNKKEHPNENFARELMELFTLGRGNYSEQDVKEVARAFTGWGINKDTGEFEFKPKQHDEGQKTIFNRTGNFGGEDVINMLVSNKQTAYFICKKMYKYYVNETVNDTHVKELAEFYYQSQYNTGSLIKKIMTSAWFYAPENMGCNIKSPIDFIVVLSRQFHIARLNPTALFQLQRALGQQLFYPPNVAGWPGGRYFIDGSKLLFRMKLPSVILNNGELNVKINPDDADDLRNETKPDQVFNKKFETQTDWAKVLEPIQQLDFDKLSKVYLLKSPQPKIMNQLRDNAGTDIKETILKLISLPEYSLM